MPATNEPVGSTAAKGDVCGKWMKRAKENCARRPNHKGKCRTAKALDERNRRKTERRRGVRKADDAAALARYRRAHKFVRLGITEDAFNAMLEAQGNACAICRESFEGRRVCADHDHNCCPMQVDQTAKTCGKCIRGLLCVKCNTALGYMEKRHDKADAYLDRYERSKRLRIVGDSGFEPLASAV